MDKNYLYSIDDPIICASGKTRQKKVVFLYYIDNHEIKNYSSIACLLPMRYRHTQILSLTTKIRSIVFIVLLDYDPSNHSVCGLLDYPLHIRQGSSQEIPRIKNMKRQVICEKCYCLWLWYCYLYHTCKSYHRKTCKSAKRNGGW